MSKPKLLEMLEGLRDPSQQAAVFIRALWVHAMTQPGQALEVSAEDIFNHPAFQNDKDGNSCFGFRIIPSDDNTCIRFEAVDASTVMQEMRESEPDENLEIELQEARGKNTTVTRKLH